MSVLYTVIVFLLIINTIVLYSWKRINEKRKRLQQYFTIFKTYSNDDWNRTTPFEEHIDLLWYHYLFHIDENVNPLILTKDIKTKFSDEKIREEMERLFGKEGSEKIYSMPLILVIFLTAALKTYREDGKGLFNAPPLSPNEFLNKTINDYKNIKLSIDGK